jgi:Methane oxygenase PmoA
VEAGRRRSSGHEERRMTIEIRGTGSRRYRVYSGGVFVAAYTVGDFRPYVYPLCTPTGTPVTEESPPDHPHHQSLWLGQDEVNGVNFWLNRPGCGRVTGTEPAACIESTSNGAAAVFRHDLTWADPEGHCLLHESRITAITPTLRGIIVDIHSDRRPADEPVTFRATKEAGLGVRVLDMLDEDDGGLLLNSRRQHGEKGTFDSQATWVDYSGTVGGRLVGVAIFSHPRNRAHSWFTRSYGIIIANHHLYEPQTLRPGDHLTLNWRVVAHDGSAAHTGLDSMYDEYLRPESLMSLR